MENFLSEHGEIILYGLIGIMVVVITCGLCKNKWNQITPEYKNEKSQSNEKFLKESKDKYPVIEGQEVIYLEYLSKKFDYSKYIKAKVYGNIDFEKKGIYKLKCVVKSDNGLTCTKYINVIVEWNMRVAIEMFSIVIAITLGCILFASFISSNNQVSNARDFYNVAVNRIEDSNCNDQVISLCKSEAGEKGYILEIEDLTIYNEQPSRLVILKYSITMPVFSLFGNGLSKQGVIEGYAR